MSLLRYASSGILRNRRRTLSSILGVLLAVTFVAGTFIAIDSSARATLDASLQGLAGDFSYYAVPLNSGPSTPVGQENGSALREALAAISGVTDVSVYLSLVSNGGGLLLYNPGQASNATVGVGSLLGIDPYHLPNMVRQATLSGSTLLPNGTVILDSQTASTVQAKIGDTVVLLSQQWNGTGPVNLTMTVTVGAIATLPSSSYGYPPGPISGPFYPYYGSIVAFNLRDLTWYQSRLNLSNPFSSQIQGEIWIDRGRFVNPYDTQSTTFQLTRLDRQLSTVMIQAGYTGNINDNISSAIQSFSTMILVQRIEYLLLSFPVILLGLYLGAVGVDLGHAERRRELGVLKTRGASRRQVALLLILESLLGGFVATILGLLFGLGLSRILIGAVTPFGTSATYGTVNLTLDTVIIVAILSTIFMAIVSYRSARRTSGLPIIETLRYYAPGETRIHYSPVWDIIFIGYSVVVYLVYWYVVSTPSNFFILMIGSLFILTLPITPILLIIGSVRLMTRSTGKVYEATSRVIRPFAKNLEYVVGRNLARNPRRSSNIAIIIALGLAFGVFIMTTLASQQAMQAESLRANIGGDMSVSPSFSFNGTSDPGFPGNLSKVAGITEITHVYPLNTLVTPNGPYQSASAMALDPSTYFSVAHPASFYFENPANQAGAQAILATSGQVLITGQFAKDAALQVGDPLFLTTSIYRNGTSSSVSITVTIGGIVRFLPGTFNGYFFGTATAQDEVYGSYATFAKLIAAAQNDQYAYYSSSDRYLVSLQPGADWKTVKADVLALGSQSVTVYQEQLDQLNNSAFYGSFLGFIRMEIAFIVIILTAGLGLIIYAASLERTVEFAGITARGSSGWQTASLLVGEAFSIMIIGVLIGLAAGLLTGYLSVSITVPTFGGSEPIIPNLFVFPLDALLLVILAPAAMLGTTVLVAWRIARMNVARVLKMRGG